MVVGVKAIFLGLLTIAAVILGIGCGVSKAKHEKTVAELEKSAAEHKRTSAELEKVTIKLKEAVVREQTVKDQALAMATTLGLENGGGSDGHADSGHGEGGRDDGHGNEGGSANPLGKDDPEELVPIVDGNDPDAANRSVVANPKGTQGKRYIVLEVYMQRSEPKDKKFKERAGKNTKRLQEIVTGELESHTVEDLQKPITKEFIRRTLQKKFNSALEGDGFHTPVGKIIFSKWIMQ